MKVYDTGNSTYGFDLVNLRYRLSPIQNQVVESDRLVYGEWLPLQHSEDGTPPFTLLEDGRLLIRHETSVFGIITSKVIRSYER